MPQDQPAQPAGADEPPRAAADLFDEEAIGSDDDGLATEYSCSWCTSDDEQDRLFIDDRHPDDLTVHGSSSGSDVRFVLICLLLGGVPISYPSVFFSFFVCLLIAFVVLPTSTTVFLFLSFFLDHTLHVLSMYYCCSSCLP